MAGKLSLDEYAQQRGNPWQKPCKTCALDDELRATVEGAVGRIPWQHIEDWLRDEHQILISVHSLRRHMRVHRA